MIRVSHSTNFLSILKGWYHTLHYCYYKLLKSDIFMFVGRTYPYFYHRYNATWKNERVVEIPIVWDVVREYKNKNILEVGNVLSHYFNVHHDIIDKYETVDGVINEDVVNFKTNKKYDLICSISTLEHVGWDEHPPEHNKILRAIENLKNLLHKDGEMIITLPIGYNKDLDLLLKQKKITFTKAYYLKRNSPDNRWVETNWEDIRDIKYGAPFQAANGVIIAFINKL